MQPEWTAHLQPPIRSCFFPFLGRGHGRYGSCATSKQTKPVLSNQTQSYPVQLKPLKPNKITSGLILCLLARECARFRLAQGDKEERRKQRVSAQYHAGAWQVLICFGFTHGEPPGALPPRLPKDSDSLLCHLL